MNLTLVAILIPHIDTYILIYIQLKSLVSDSQNGPFYQNDLDLDPVNLILKHDLDMVKMYHHAKNKVS